jgi:hypothetical protein
MKKTFSIAVAVLACFCMHSQTTGDIGKITLSVIMPDNVEGLDASQLSKLETKITQIVSATGMASSGYNNNFVIYPKFSVTETNVVEGGMQNITVASCDLSLFIKQVDNNMLFATVSKSLKGSGSNKQAALSNAISKIPASDPQFKTFIENGKTKIIQYYESKCPDIIVKADNFVKKQNYEDALGLLQTVPEEVSCHAKIQDKSIEIYKLYQNQQCSKFLQEAKLAMAANNQYDALQILGKIDPGSTCYKESLNLMKSAETKITAEEKKNWDLQMKVYDDAVALEKLRVNAVKDIAAAYYKSKPQTVNYSYIVR